MLGFIINWVINLIVLLILARAIISFLPIDRFNPVVQIINRLTEPMLAPIRRLIPPTSGFDFSPLVLFIALTLLRNVLLSIF